MALRKIQAEIKQACMHEALLYNSLYIFRKKMQNTRHHLFDNIETNADLANVEFTEEDLDQNEKEEEGEWDYKVKSTPSKMSQKN